MPVIYFTHTIFLPAWLAFWFYYVVSCNKTELSLLTFLPFDATEQIGWPGCNTAIKIVIDETNNRDDILPGYKLVQQIENEGPSAILSNTNFIKYYRRPEDANNVNSTKLLSPVILGPTIACHLVALSMRTLHFTSFSPQCAGPYIVARRKLFSTLYSAQTSAGSSSAMATFAVMRQIGNWSQFAIVTNANNPNEYMMAPIIQDAATRVSMRVLHYANEYDITEDTITTLKASGARIIAVAMVQLPLCLKLLCLGYFAGLRTPLYVFILTSFNCMFDADNPSLPRPPGCSKEVLALQLKGTIFAGVYTNRIGVESHLKTSFGYDEAYFETKFNALTNNRKPPDYDFRHTCHDAAMAAVVTLNKSDELLRTHHNKTLKDFQAYPELIGRIVNDTASKINFVGIRIGKFAYSRNRELKEDFWIGQLLEGGKPRMWYRMQKLENVGENSSELDVAGYNLIEVEAPQWFTKSGKPPKDLSDISHRIAYCERSLIGVVVALAAIVTLAQAVLLSRSCIAQESSIRYFDYKQKLLLLFGCLCLNSSAAILLVGCDYFTIVECRIRPVLTTIGLSIINAILLMHTLCYAKFMSLLRKGISARKTPGAASHNKEPAASMERGESSLQGIVTATGVQLPNIATLSHSSRIYLTITIGVAFLCTVSISVMIGWVVSDPLQATYQVSAIRFDDESDTYFDLRRHSCTSRYETFWLAALLVIQACQLLPAAFFAYDAGRVILPAGPAASDCKFFRIAVVNASFLFLGILLILLVLSSSEITCIQIAVLAIGELIYSSSSFAILIIPK